MTAPAPDLASEDVARRIAHAPLPTDATLRRRRSVPVQLWKAARFSSKILSVVRSGH